MITSANSIVSVLFFPPFDIPNKAAFVSGFSEFTRIFDADPMILPIGNAPPGVPRIVLKKRDGSYACEIALDRLSFTYADTINCKRSLEALYPEYRGHLQFVVEAALAGIGSPVIRMGFVTRHLLELGAGANEWIRRWFLRADRLPGEAFETHVNVLHRLDLESFPVNRWIKIRSLRDQQHPERDPAALLEIDINTLPEHTGPYDRTALLAFYLEGFARAEEELKACLAEVTEP